MSSRMAKAVTLTYAKKYAKVFWKYNGVAGEGTIVSGAGLDFSLSALAVRLPLLPAATSLL